MKEDRYYVQHLSEQIFVIRERASEGEESEQEHRIVRSFTVAHDAFQYSDSINARQRQLDEQFGHWTQKAAEASQTW